MGNALRNAAGTLIGEHGFVLCRTCLRECESLSRETSSEYAYCIMCRKSTQHKEVHMPSAPKPSQVEAGAATPKKKYVRPSRAKKPVTVKEKVAKIIREMRPSNGAHTPPIRGKSGLWLTEIKAAGGITKDELIAGCIPHGLGVTMHVAMRSYCRQLGLLKD